MKYVFHPDALAEYAEAVKYYANQNREIAQAFINSFAQRRLCRIEDAVYRIRESATRYPEIDEDVRRCMARKFPYAVLYSIEQDYLLIIAVMYCSREPNYWKNRQS
jgi:toxin ParE1/3/4